MRELQSLRSAYAGIAGIAGLRGDHLCDFHQMRELQSLRSAYAGIASGALAREWAQECCDPIRRRQRFVISKSSTLSQ